MSFKKISAKFSSSDTGGAITGAQAGRGRNLSSGDQIFSAASGASGQLFTDLSVQMLNPLTYFRPVCAKDPDANYIQNGESNNRNNNNNNNNNSVPSSDANASGRNLQAHQIWPRGFPLDFVQAGFSLKENKVI
jgi:hypothetical protein